MDLFKRVQKLHLDEGWLFEQIHSVLRVVKGVFFCHTAAYFRFLPEKAKLVLTDFISDSEEVQLEAAVDLGVGIIGWVAKEQKATVTGKHSSALPYYRKQIEIRTIAAAPVVIEDYLIGVLVMDNPERDAYSWQDKEILVELGNFIGTAVCTNALQDRSELSNPEPK